MFLLAYLAGLVFAFLDPSADIAGRFVAAVASTGRDAGVPEVLLTADRAEFICNALIITPAVLAAALLWPDRSWTTWTAYGFVGSLSIEVVQGLFLPDRNASFVDVVANTLGALLGSVAGFLVIRLARARRS
jgi:glycopeptide antibiotics resistance protein